MAFTSEEKRKWHEERQQQADRLEQQRRAAWKPSPIAICINCQNPFGINEGVITDDVAMCDLCLGD